MNKSDLEYKSNFYPIKVWLLSILGGPIILPILFLIENGFDLNGFFNFYLWIFWIGFLFSIPSLIISYIVYRYFLFKKIKPIHIKFTLIILGFVLFTATLYMMGLRLHKIDELESASMPISYSFFFILGSILFKVEKNIRR